MKINLRPNIDHLDASNIGALIDEYLSARQGKPHTLATYRYLFDVFLRWWQDFPDHRLSRTACDQYAASLSNLSPSTRTKALSLLRRLLAWGFRNGYIERDVSEWVPKATGYSKPLVAPSHDAILRLMEAAADSWDPRRNMAILAVLIGTGIRRAELAALNVDDVVVDASGSGIIHIRNGKGDKPRSVVFDEVTGRYLVAYLDTKVRPTGPLFTGRRGRLTPRSIYQVVRQLAKAAGVHNEVKGPHDLRRLFATNWIRYHRGEGYSQLLQLQLGHSDISQTMRYSKPTLSDVQDEFISPLKATLKLG